MALQKGPKHVWGKVVVMGDALGVDFEGGILGVHEVPERVVYEKDLRDGQRVRVNFLDAETPRWDTLTLRG